MASVNNLGKFVLQLVRVLESYRGRDKIMRLISYVCTLLGGSIQHTRFIRLAQKLFRVGDALSDCRVVLRLFDDLAMLCYTLNYGLGKQEKDVISRCASLVQNVFDQGYYPIEHVAWGIDTKLFEGNSSSVWCIGCNFWVGSLLMSIVTNLRKLGQLNHDEVTHKRMALLDSHLAPVSSRHLDSSTENTTSLQSRTIGESEDTHFSRNISPTSTHKLCFIKKKKQELMISTVGCVCDAICGIHWSQPGVLWAGKLSPALVGLLGTISSSCFLYNYLLPAVEEEEDNADRLGPDY